MDQEGGSTMSLKQAQSEASHRARKFGN